MPLLVLFILLLASHSVASCLSRPTERRFGAKARFATWSQFWNAYRHAFGVLLATGNLYAAGFELVAHLFIDYGRYSARYGPNADQALHVATKVLIVLARAKGLV